MSEIDLRQAQVFPMDSSTSHTSATASSRGTLAGGSDER